MRQESKILGVRYTGEEIKDYDKVVALAKENDSFTSDVAKLLINTGLVNSENSGPGLKDKIRDKTNNKIDSRIKSLQDSKTEGKQKSITEGKKEGKKVNKRLLWFIIGLAGLCFSAVYLVTKYGKEMKEKQGTSQKSSTVKEDGFWWRPKE